MRWCRGSELTDLIKTQIELQKMKMHCNEKLNDKCHLPQSSGPTYFDCTLAACPPGKGRFRRITQNTYKHTCKEEDGEWEEAVF